MTRFVVIGEADCRRVDGFRQAISSIENTELLWIPFSDVLSGDRLAKTLLPNDVVRIEFPTHSGDIAREILRLGYAPARHEGYSVVSPENTAGLEIQFGQIVWPRQWFHGFCELLQRIERCVAPVEGCTLMNARAGIERMFDKFACHEFLRARGLPVTESLGLATSWEELVTAVDVIQSSRVFVKLANAASASGVLALHRFKNRWVGLTTVEVEKTQNAGPPAQRAPRFFNRRKLIRLTDEAEIRTVFEFLAANRAVVERWHPKAAVDHRSVFDIRLLVVAGRPAHRVIRSSTTPITNLNLGNQRGDWKKLIDARTNQRIESLGAEVAAAFPAMHYFGIDLLLSPDFRELRVIELNSMGDLLPGLTFNGRSTFEHEIRCWD